MLMVKQYALLGGLKEKAPRVFSLGIVLTNFSNMLVSILRPLCLHAAIVFSIEN